MIQSPGWYSGNIQHRTKAICMFWDSGGSGDGTFSWCPGISFAFPICSCMQSLCFKCKNMVPLGKQQRRKQDWKYRSAQISIVLYLLCRTFVTINMFLNEYNTWKILLMDIDMVNKDYITFLFVFSEHNLLQVAWQSKLSNIVTLCYTRFSALLCTFIMLLSLCPPLYSNMKKYTALKYCNYLVGSEWKTDTVLVRISVFCMPFSVLFSLLSHRVYVYRLFIT